MKKAISLFLAVLMVASVAIAALPVGALTATAGWSKGDDGKWHIASAEDLLAFGESTSAFDGETVVLDADIVFNDLTADYMKTNGAPNVWVQNCDWFKGTFDGQGHYIKGLYINSGERAFVRQAEGAVAFRNVSFIEACSTNGTGLIVRKSFSPIIFENVYVSGYISGPANIGAFCSYFDSSYTASAAFTNCWFDGTIESGQNIGGFVGDMCGWPVTFTDCLTTGSIINNGNGPVGALGGRCTGTVTATRCLNLATAHRNIGGSLYGGSCICWGFEGSVTLTDCYNASSDSTTYNNIYDASTWAGIGSVAASSISAADVSSLADTFTAHGGDGWGTKQYGDSVIAVPACFADSSETPTEPETPSEPEASVHIATLEDLIAFGENSSDFSGEKVVLDNDIVFNDKTADEMKADSTGLNVWVQNAATFSGIFDGQGHSIKGLYSASGTGLFGDVNNAAIRNLYLLDSCVTYSGNGVGLVAKTAYGAIFENVYVNGYISAANNFGGFCGEINWGSDEHGGPTFKGCWFDGTAESAGKTSADIGGFAGSMNGCDKVVKFIDCLNSGTVNAKGGGNVAGFVGLVSSDITGSLSFTRCATTGDVKRANGKAKGWAFIAKGGSKVTAADSFCDESKYNGGSGNPSDGSITYAAATAGELVYAVALESTWALTSEGLMVPAYFADSEPVGPETPSVWDKSDDGKWHIATVDDLIAFGKSESVFSGETIVLDDDIVFNDKTADEMKGSAPSRVWMQNAATFSGTFDGQGHSIKGLYSSSGNGLFGNVIGATVKNLYLLDSCVISSVNGVGMLAKTVYNTVFENVYVNGYISGANNFGGFCGEINWGSDEHGGPTFTSCWFDGTVEGTGSNIGGFAGIAYKCDKEVKFTDCLNTGTVSTSHAGANIAGIIGQVDASITGSISFTRCVTVGKVTHGGTNRGYSFTTCTRDKVTTVDCFCDDSMYGMSGNMYNGSWGTDTTATHTNILSTSELSAVASFADTWAENPDSQMVPKYFKDFGSGSGTSEPETPSDWTKGDDGKWHIATLEDLIAFGKSTSDFSGETVVLDDDVIFNSKTAAQMKSKVPANIWQQKASWFKGTFDGQGHYIQGLYSASGNGLFGSLLGAEVKNLYLIESFVSSDGNGIGLVAKSVYNSAIENVYVSGYLKGASSIGGFCAQVCSGGDIGAPTFTSCWFDGTVDGTGTDIGGFAGVASGCDKEVKFTDCLNTGTVISAQAGANVAGFIGKTDAALTGSLRFTRCVVIGPVNHGGGSYRGYAFCTYERFSSLVDCFCDEGKYSNASGNPYDGEFDYTAATATELLSAAALAETWAKNPNSIMVPEYFKDRDVGSEISTEPSETIVISTWDELVSWASNGSDDLDCLVLLDADITAPDDVSWTPKPSFAGIFNGQGHFIKGLYIESSAQCLAFISRLYTATVKNLYLIDCTFKGTGESHMNGGVVGNTHGKCVIENVYSNAIVAAKNHAGGIIGSVENASVVITSCWFDGEIVCTGTLASGIIGCHNSMEATITDCLNTGRISAAEGQNASGITTGIYTGKLFATRCVNTGEVYLGANKDGCSIFKTLSGTGEAYLVDCFNLKGTCKTKPNDVRGKSVVFEGVITEFVSFGNPTVFASLADTWVFTVHNGKKIVVPAYFGGEDASVIPVYDLNAPSVTNFEFKTEGNWGPRWTVSFEIPEGFTKDTVKLGMLIVPTKVMDGALISLEETEYQYRGNTYPVANVAATLFKESDDGKLVATFVLTDLSEKTIRSNLTFCPYALYLAPEGDIGICGEFSTLNFYTEAKLVTDPALKAKLDEVLAPVDAAIGEGFTVSRDWSTLDVFEDLPAFVFESNKRIKLLPVEDKGCGEYTLIAQGTNGEAVDYVKRLENCGFTLVYSNVLTEGVEIYQLTKGDLLVTVNDIGYTNRTYISAMFDQKLSPHLEDNYKSEAKPGAVNSLHQIDLYWWGDSYVIKLKNGHFILVDGATEFELGLLLDYLETLVPSGEKPVIEAWCNTHQHPDHIRLLTQFIDNPDWVDRVVVEGFYINQPSEAVVRIDQLENDIARERKAIAMLKTSSGGTPEIYRPTIGQRYWFCDVSMDIMVSQEMIPFNGYVGGEAGGYNECSTWYKFTIDGQTFLEPGDAKNTAMSFVMNAYDPEDMQVDFFSVMHHSYNTWDTFTNWVEEFKTILYPTMAVEKEGVLAQERHQNLNSRGEEYFFAGEGTDVFYFPYTVGKTGTDGGHVKLPDLPEHHG